MKGFFQKNHHFIFYGLLLLLDILQAASTELQDDEAYYWVYSHYPAWGYFDHPPLIAILIKAGYAIFPNGLGVRLFPLLLNIATLLIIEKLLVRKNPFLFYAIVLSIAVIQIVGFLAIPDIPLLFFTALFFLWYRRFLNQATFANTFLLGLVMALLMYSKYHGVLIILFTLLSNFSLLKKRQAWMAVAISILLFLPHLWWQYQHNWISIRYHLFESNTSAYKISYTLDYLWPQILLIGPLAGILLLPAAFLYKPKDETERAMHFTMIGVFVFFFVSSFKGKVEANWTLPAFVCIMVLSHQWLVENIRFQKWVKTFALLTTIVVMIGRIGMIKDILPIKAVKQRYHMWKDWPREMKEKLEGLPVVFNSSYQRASKFWFYSGQMTYSLNLYKERENNYNFWPVEDSLLGKPVYILDKYDLWRFADSVKTPMGYVGYKYDSSFASFAKVNIEVAPSEINCKAGDSLSVSYQFQIPTYYARFIEAAKNLQDTTRVGIFNSKGWVKDVYTSISLKQAVQQPAGSLTWKPQLPPGVYYFLFAINNGTYYPTHNSRKIKLIIK